MGDGSAVEWDRDGRARNRPRSTGRISRRAAWLAWSVCGLTLSSIACAVALTFFNGSDLRSTIFPLGLAVSAVVGGLVASRRPANPVGWFFLGSGGCLAAKVVANEYAAYGLPGVRAMA
ncbi:MAG: hypothetical protein ACRDTR_08640 [Rubrobacter sp.]